MTVVGLLLSRSAELLQSHDKHGKTGLHIAATHGHYQMVEVLLGELPNPINLLACSHKNNFLQVKVQKSMPQIGMGTPLYIALPGQGALMW